MSIIQCSCLGNLGKFGNSLTQYCFAKSYAEITNSTLEIPKNWIGRKIFKIAEKEKAISKTLPTITEDNLVLFSNVRNMEDVDLYGFFQQPVFYNLISLSKCREWLQIQDKWIDKFLKIKPYYIACHLRRGDFVTLHHSYPVIQEIAYLFAVIRYKYQTKDILWFSEDIAYKDKECSALGIDFLPDFMHLINSDVLFRGPSTFGFWAGIIGNHTVYSPEIDFPDYGNGKVGFIGNVEFKLGLGPNKEGVFKP